MIYKREFKIWGTIDVWQNKIKGTIEFIFVNFVFSLNFTNFASD